MRKITASIVFTCLNVLLTLLTSCGGGINENIARPDLSGGSTTSSSSIYPLKVGNTWTYSSSQGGSYTISIDGTTTVNGSYVYMRTTEGESYYTYLNWETSGLTYYGTSVSTLASPCVLLPNTLYVGLNYTDTCNEFSCTVSKIENVTVPAGTFNNCYQVDCYDGTDLWDTTWYCSGVGMVKLVDYDMNPGPVPYDITDSLSSYTVN